MKNLALAFCSIRPSQYPDNVCDNREKEYLRSLKQLQRVLPKSFDLLVCENTIDDAGQIKNDELRDFLNDTEMCATGSESNMGTANKGMGELTLLKSGLDQIDPDDYENIAYVTGRQFYTCPYVFERTERLEKDALLSYPDFVFLDGRVQENEKGKLFNDMFFSMKSDKMVMYADFSIQRMDYNLQNQIGSEYNLYDFVERNNIEYEWLDFLGLIRNDWQRNNNASDISNYHVC